MMRWHAGGRTSKEAHEPKPNAAAAGHPAGARSAGEDRRPGSLAIMLALAFLAVHHFATTSWPLSHGQPGLLVAVGLLLILAQALKAVGWARLFTKDERPSPLALVARNGGAALIGVVLPGRFDDAMRIAVVRRYPGCPAGLRAISL